VLARVIGSVRDVRRRGAATADLCSIAEGTTDAYWEMGLNEWDRAAGALIATEAGAAVQIIGGGDLADHGPEDRGLVAAHPALIGQFQELLASASAGDV
jgi:myo-inositol-1(or 4)-monophosphatase